MGRMKPCITCGKPTSRILFGHSPDEVAICSSNCQIGYFATLSAEKANVLQAVHSIDERIAEVRKYEICCWIIAGFGLLILVLGVHLARTLPQWQARTGSDIFLIGAVPLTIGAIATEHFSAMRRKLMAKRRQVI